MRKIIFLMWLCCAAVSAGGQTLHRIGVETHSGYIFPTHRFLAGENHRHSPIDRSLSFHLKYGFQNPRRGHAPTAYQGIGISHHRFPYTTPKLPPSSCDPSSGCYGSLSYIPDSDFPHELGNPTAFYLFQGAQIARITSRLSLDYEWNFGLSFGWRPYDFVENNFNLVVGSRVNAYLNTQVFLRYRLSRAIDLTGGVDVAHFSNGNTELPNAGVNTIGAAFGAAYHFNRPQEEVSRPRRENDFRPHVSYEALLFGGWRKKGVGFGGELYASPHTYTVAGFSFAPMYNAGRKVRFGLSLDGVYDGSANVYIADWPAGLPPNEVFIAPPRNKQWALGLAAQADYVMPYFTLTAGFGANVLHGGGDLKSFYQKLALKIDLTRNTFLHIGYSLREFNAPNFLMLGVGMRFN